MPEKNPQADVSSARQSANIGVGGHQSSNCSCGERKYSIPLGLRAAQRSAEVPKMIGGPSGRPGRIDPEAPPPLRSGHRAARGRSSAVQAPMGFIARAQLASAVSNAGAFGIVETSSGRLDEVRARWRRCAI